MTANPADANQEGVVSVSSMLTFSRRLANGISLEIRALCAEMPREEVAFTIARRLARDASRGAGQTISGCRAADQHVSAQPGLEAPDEGYLSPPNAPDGCASYV